VNAVPATDEIYEKYLQKAIVEINDLAHEVASAGGAACRCIGSGHPLADVILLKHRPQPAEVQEGVAFYGRAGQAILKSLQRLHVDPMSVYGTNCLKFADGDEDESRAFLDPRAAHRPAEADRADGRGRGRVPELARVPARRTPWSTSRASCNASRRRRRRSSSRTSTLARRGARQDPSFGTRSSLSATGGPSCRPTSSPRGARALLRVPRSAVERVAVVGHRVPRLVLIPACFALVWLVLPLRTWREADRARLGLAVSPGVPRKPAGAHAENFCKLFAVAFVGFAFLEYFETLSWVVLVAADHSRWSTRTRSSRARGPTNVIVKQHRQVFTTFSFAFPIPGEHAAANLGLPRPALLLPLPRRRPHASASGRLDVARDDGVVRHLARDRLGVARRPPRVAAARDLVSRRQRRLDLGAGSRARRARHSQPFRRERF
jgi:hypothetical protein